MIKCFNVALTFSFLSALIISQPVYSQTISSTDKDCFVSFPDGTTRPLTDEEINRGSVQKFGVNLLQNGSLFSFGVTSTNMDNWTRQYYQSLRKEQKEKQPQYIQQLIPLNLEKMENIEPNLTDDNLEQENSTSTSTPPTVTSTVTSTPPTVTSTSSKP
jgi:hypothetical protein